MPTFRFLQLDVFASRLLDGNPLAVVLGADAMDASTMQRIARWTNLSETTFLLRPMQPQADYRVRIFTPRQELPFAGHPSVGRAHAAFAVCLRGLRWYRNALRACCRYPWKATARAQHPCAGAARAHHASRCRAARWPCARSVLPMAYRKTR